MIRRFISLLLMLMLASCALGEESPAPTEAPAPTDIRLAATIEEAEACLLLPRDGADPGVQRGLVRYITQDTKSDPAFLKEYWLGGPEGSELDLTLRERYGHVFTFHTGVMCTRAVYSMAMSYLGLDVTPGGMTAMTGKRNLDPPYRSVSKEIGVELVQPKSHVFNTMMDNYLTDSSYSPVYLYIEKPGGTEHALLVVAALPEASRYLVVDPLAYHLEGETCPVYMIALNKTRQQIVNSTFRSDLAGSKVLQIYQWRLIEDENINE